MDGPNWNRHTPQDAHLTKLCIARALYDNIAESPDELIFRKGDLLTVLEQNTQGMEGWWLCSLKGRQGICPANRLRLIAGVYATVPDTQDRKTLDLDYPPNRNRMSGEHWKSHVVLPQRIGDCYTYDVPRNIPEDYDIPKNQHLLPATDNLPAYDVPRTFLKHDQSFDSVDYDCPRNNPVPVIPQSNSSTAYPTYDVPQSQVTYDVPQAHITVVDHVKRCSGLSVLSGSSSGSSLSVGDTFSSGSGSARSSIEQNPQDMYDIPPSDPKRVKVNPENSYDIPRNAVLGENSKHVDPVVYDVPQNDKPVSSQGGDLNSRLSLLSLTSQHSGSSQDSGDASLPMEGEAGAQLLDKLRDDVCDCVNKVCAFGIPNWRARGSLENKLPDLKSCIMRFRGSLKTFVDFSNGCLVTAMRNGDEKLTTKLQKCFQPVLDSYSIINKNTESLNAQGWVLDSLVEKGSNKTGDDLDQLMACTSNLQEDIQQLAALIRSSSSSLFNRKYSFPKKPSINNDLENDYEYITLDRQEEKDGPVSNDTKKSFEKLMKDSLMATDRVKFLRSISSSTLNPNDRQVLQFYSIQAETHVLYLNNAIDAFFTTIQNNQPPKVFIGHSKFLILTAHKLIYIGDTVYRNVLNESIRTKVLNYANKLCEGLKQAVQSTKTAALQFPSVSAVQQMVDAVMKIAHLARDLKVVIAAAAHS